MHFTTTTLAALAAVASAKTVKVKVGGGGLVFQPETIEAEKGDTLQFSFSGEHTVVQGDYKKGCEPVSSGGFYSGVFGEDDKTKVNYISYHTSFIGEADFLIAGQGL